MDNIPLTKANMVSNCSVLHGLRLNYS